ncbi:hypothetical protein CLTEP_09730 [Clostridium tepidiprofundi DSM 19306]|uniref:Uncharacterized protein n=1 Tax=Clostridium tepidiprofundi DSM 19306 TaxID=1121338 RepID=A0A151B5R6_9CLOT|nr:hypothetical protein [Clostridium tepidiprofundi]KYH35153.1 hypothetical protein CLTEP_09730 [Clostridium tepidiprofundi DSM 19306]
MFSRIPNQCYDQFTMYPNEMGQNPKNFERTTNERVPNTTNTPNLEKKPVIPPSPAPKYFQNWLIEQIGKYIKIEFLIGTSMLIDREGVLEEVGVNYIVIKESGTLDTLMCDMYSIKFVRVFHDQAKALSCK